MPILNKDNKILNLSGGKILSISTPKYKLPDGCILCDYFKPGFRFGILQQGYSIPVVEYEDGNTNNLDYFEHEIFGNTFPAGNIDFEQTDNVNDKIFYDITNEINTEFSLEYLIRFNADYPTIKWGRNVFILTITSGLYLQFYFPSNYGNTQAGANYAGNSSWSGWLSMPSIPPASNINGAASKLPSKWKHVAISVKNNDLKIFVNGYQIYNPTNCQIPNNIAKIVLSPYTYNVNNTEKLGYYDITQLAMWNYCKYESNFNVSTKLIIDPSYI